MISSISINYVFGKITGNEKEFNGNIKG